MPGWLAYLAFGAVYLLVFGPTIAGIAAAYLSEGAAPLRPPPSADTFWEMALPGWGKHAVLLAVVAGCAWLVVWRRKLLLGDLFTPLWMSHTWAEQVAWRRQGRRVFGLALAGMTCWMVSAALVGLLVPSPLSGGFPIDDRADAVWTTLMLGPTLVTTAPIEETVVVAILVVLLNAAGRPAAEIYTIGVVAKLAYHAYYGPVVLLLIPEALLVIWLYRRTGRLWPIIAAHIVYNLLYSVLVIAWPPVATFMG